MQMEDPRTTTLGDSGLFDQETGHSLMIALSAAQEEVMLMRRTLQEGSLDLLEAKSAHARSISNNQTELSKREKEIVSLRDELERVKQRALAVSLAHDAEVEELKGRCETLRLQLELSHDTPSSSARTAALSALESSVCALRGQLEEARSAVEASHREAESLRATLYEAQMEAKSSREEAKFSNAQAAEQAARVRAIQEQLASVVSRDAGDAARAAAAGLPPPSCPHQHRPTFCAKRQHRYRN